VSPAAPPTDAPTPGTRRAKTASAEPQSKPATDAKASETPDLAKKPADAKTSPARSKTAGRPVPTVGTVWKVLAVLGVIGTIGFALAWRAADSRAATEDGLAPAAVEMRTAGREFAIALTNFDAATIDADFDRILDFATGDFAEEAEGFYDEEIRTGLRDAQATSRSEIRDIYVQSFGKDRGVVFFVADQTVANNLSPQPTTDTLRVELSMVRTGGEWKVGGVEVLDAPAGSQLDASGLAEEGQTEPTGEDVTTTTAPG
jgi:Mce-associated membrane protein